MGQSIGVSVFVIDFEDPSWGGFYVVKGTYNLGIRRGLARMVSVRRHNMARSDVNT